MSEQSERASTQPLTILIAALGGEGGGVLMNWIVEAARASGLAVQATSVPGVAQRTGSTSYYIEVLQPPESAGSDPVFALFPMPGRVDIAIASEHIEAARLMERGFISPKRTTLIMSTSRVYTTAEKMQMGDGRFEPGKVEAAARALARKLIAVDLDVIARDNGTMISAAMFGALAGAGVLPWPRSQCEQVLGSGAAAEASRRGFTVAFAAASGGAVAVPQAIGSKQAQASPGPAAAGLAGLPEHIRATARHGHTRVVDYQDADYGALYLARLCALVSATTAMDDPIAAHALDEAARRLALWMAYEDIPRVADLKTRPERFAQIRADAEMSDGQILRVTEHMKPGVDEIAAMLPEGLGRRLTAYAVRGRWVPLAGRDLHVRSTGGIGYMLLRGLARMKSIRRRSLRFAEEQAAIERWLAAMAQTLAHAPSFAGALAELPRLRKGYGDTQARGNRNYEAIFAGIVAPAVLARQEGEATPRLRAAIAAALADPNGLALATVQPVPGAAHHAGGAVRAP